MTIYLDIKADGDMPEIAVDYIKAETADGKEYAAEYPETEYTQGDGVYASRMKGAGLYEGAYGESEVVFANNRLAEILGKGISRALVGVSCLAEDGADAEATLRMSGTPEFVIGTERFIPGKVYYEPADGWNVKA